MSVDTEKDLVANGAPTEKTENEKKPYKLRIVWFNTIGFLILHLAAVYGLFLLFTSTKLLTILWTYLVMLGAGQGIGLGAHRLYTHRALKANKAMRIILVTLQTIAGENCMYIWVRDHRQHHKYSDTDADPHNSKRGFFFSHIGWLMVRKHPDVIEKGKTIDMSDLEADPIVMFQKTHYKKLYTIFALALPTLVPYYCWNESLWVSFFVAFILRVVLVLNFTWLVNSAAHAYGNRPFTKSIVPVETGIVSVLTMGEGWHNYHHSFPWDYRASEYGQYFNFTTTVINYLAKYGWLYDLRTASPDMVIRRILKQGDGTHPKLDELAKKFDTMNEVPKTQDLDNGDDKNKLENTLKKHRPKGAT